MTTRPYFIFTAILLLMFPLSLRAQKAQSSSTSKDANRNRQVIGSVSETRIRFTSLGDLTQVRLEVIGPAGESLFDSGFKPGNVLDWPASDFKGQQIGDGTYLCVVSVKDATGEIVRKHAIATVRDQSVTLLEPNTSLLSSSQSASLVTGEDVNVTIVEAAAAPTAVLAHDGATAHLVSGGGGLSISSGDFFANKLHEQIRLTAEGNVGIGVANPQARLDVAGRIKATEGIVFPDGSVQLSAARNTLGAASLKGGDSQDGMAQIASPDIGGTGTTGKISKWLDGPNGVLNDSNITEVSGSIGINGTPSTSFRLDVNGSTRIRGSNPGFNLEGLRAAGNIWLFQTVDDDGRFRLFGQDNVNPGVERLTISLSTGNVGIGATGAAGKLDVGGAINTSTQYNIGGDRILSNGGSFNLFAGSGAGLVNAGGAANAFFGSDAGLHNTEGGDNSFFGNTAGLFNTTQSANTFIGSLAGFRNGDGDTNNLANGNTFIGGEAGGRNTTGAGNVFVGANAGLSNLSGNRSTAIGYGADFAAANLENATAIGANARVSQNDSLVLGSITGVNGASTNTKVGIGTTAPGYKLEIVDFGNAGLRVQTNTTGGKLASFGGAGNFQIDSNGVAGGRLTVLEDGRVGIGVNNPQATLHVSGNGIVRALVSSSSNAGLSLGLGSQPQWSVATVTGGEFQIFNDAGNAKAFSIDSANNNVGIGTTSAPLAKLDVNGVIRVATLGSAGGLALCRNANSEISMCSSSRRYKTNIATMQTGLGLISQLRPVTFDWKASHERDLGLVAEEVAKVEPMLVFHNDKGEIEGVKYDRLNVFLLNAVKEQQKQIEMLTRIVCRDHPRAGGCTAKRLAARVSKTRP